MRVRGHSQSAQRKDRGHNQALGKKRDAIQDLSLLSHSMPNQKSRLEHWALKMWTRGAAAARTNQSQSTVEDVDYDIFYFRINEEVTVSPAKQPNKN